jgi:hypothetical protein
MITRGRNASLAALAVEAMRLQRLRLMHINPCIAKRGSRPGSASVLARAARTTALSSLCVDDACALSVRALHQPMPPIYTGIVKLWARVSGRWQET